MTPPVRPQFARCKRRVAVTPPDQDGYSMPDGLLRVSLARGGQSLRQRYDFHDLSRQDVHHGAHGLLIRASTAHRDME
jgi:hypothetical protein